MKISLESARFHLAIPTILSDLVKEEYDRLKEVFPKLADTGGRRG